MSSILPTSLEHAGANAGPAVVSQREPGRRRFRQRWFEVRRSISTTSVVLLGVIGTAAFVGAWQWQAGSSGSVILATPADVLKALWTLLVEKEFAKDVGVSTLRIVGSFALACAIAVPLGVAMGTFARLEALFNPLIAAWRYLPAPAFVPLLLMWFGTGEGQKLALLFLGVFFFLVILVVDHTRQVSMDLLEVAQTLGAKRAQLVFRVIVPAVLPAIVDVMRQMLAVSWTYLVIAEIVASTDGIGAVMMRAKRFMKTEDVMAGILVIGLLGLVFDYLFRGVSWLAFPYLRGRGSRP